MMDHKTWLWKKKSSEKTMVAAEKVNVSLTENEEALLTDKEALKRDLKMLDEKLSSAVSECNSKDEYAKTQEKIAQEAVADLENAESEAISLKQELGKAVQQKVAGEERIAHLDGALRECMQQLHFVREEQEKRIHDAVMKTSSDYEKMRIVLEEKLTETSKRLAKSGAENTQLTQALLRKEKVTEDLNERRVRAETDFHALRIKLESKEKENASLKYEVSVLEKELEIRNEEREFNRRTADVAHNQHLDSVKKIAKLESECQRLRLLVQKRLPGPAALVKMKNEVAILGRDPVGTRRKSNSSQAGSMDFAVENTLDSPSKRIKFLNEQLRVMEQENVTLKETLNQKTDELQFFRITYARTASKLSQVEARVEESSRGQTAVGLAGNLKIGGDDKVSCTEAWASALISELEHFRNAEQMGTSSRKSAGTSDITLMDDFVEMEKLAVVSMHMPCGNSHLHSEASSAVDGPLKNQSDGYPLKAAGRETDPVSVSQSGPFVSNQELQFMNTGIDKVPGWLSDILTMISEQAHVTRRNIYELLEDIKVALANIRHPNPDDAFDVSESAYHPNTSIMINLQDKSSIMDSPDIVSGEQSSTSKKSNQQIQTNLNKSIRKTIDLIERISLQLQDFSIADSSFGKDDNPVSSENSEKSTGYMVHVFQWKTSELIVVLQQFVQTCNDLLNGKADLQRFSKELASALEWITNHCFSLQDVSSMRDAIKKHFGWDESRSETEVAGGMSNQFSGANKSHVPKEQLSCTPTVSSWKGHNFFSQMEELQPMVREESRRSKSKSEIMESVKKDSEGRFPSETANSQSLMIQLQTSGKTIQSLRKEFEILKGSEGMIEDQIENHKMVTEDLDTQLTLAEVEINEALQKFSSLDKELENKNNFGQELESTCLEPQLQLESETKKDIPECDTGQENQLRTDLEITAASEKLAECQETIINLGKQLKSLASPKDKRHFNNDISIPTGLIITTRTPKKNINQRSSSLLDKMLAEDNSDRGHHMSPKTKEVIEAPDTFLLSNGSKRRDNEAVVNSLAIEQSRKGGEGLLKKLLWRQRRSNIKKTPFICAI